MEERRKKSFKKQINYKKETDGVPILRIGSNNNLLKFKKAIIIKTGELYGDLAKTLEANEYYTTPEVDETDFDLANDPHGLNMLALQ